MTASPQLLASRCVSILAMVIAALCALFVTSNGWAESAVPQVSHTTMIVFTDHPMAGDQWSALVRELHRTDVRLETIDEELAGGLEVLRASDLVTGVAVDKLMTVKIVGDCALFPRPRRTVRGALGWVKKVDGEIQPFIFVDCEKAAEMLGPMALGMNRDRRNTVMAEAMARVIAHEWIHIAKQEPHHEKRGVMQSQFEISDLLADDKPNKPKNHSCREKKGALGF